MNSQWRGLCIGLLAASTGNPVDAVAQDPRSTESASRNVGGLISNTSGHRDERWEFFEKRIRPLLVVRCLECHNDQDAKGGLSLSNRERWLRGGVTGPAIDAGNPASSLLMKAVGYGDADLQMPPDEPLSAEEQGWLAKWIEDGAFDPRAEGEPGVETPRTVAMESHWAYRPFEAKPLPTQVTFDGSSSREKLVGEKLVGEKLVGEKGNIDRSGRDRADRTTENGIESPIDRWIEAKLASLDLEPVGSADRRSWLRRATYDMTGLPPSSEEVESFEADERPDAYQRVVERLLASPKYGEHWGRHWLDVVRYADSNGLDENIAYGNAWRYRDYVVASLNQDKPWNRFIMEQVAGDLLPDVLLETRTGTGFLVLGAKVLAEPDRDKLIWDTIDEQVDTLGKAFLGMTLGCARCHDHKFDPWKQEEYFALAGIFRNTKTFGDTNFGAIKHWNEFVFASAEERASIAEVEKRIAEQQKVANEFKARELEKLRQEARGKVVEYLVAATCLPPDVSLPECEAVAAPLGLHPRILHQCRRHLEFERDHPFFQAWHAYQLADDAAGLRAHYADLFGRLAALAAAGQPTGGQSGDVVDPRLEQARSVLQDVTGLLALPVRAVEAFDAKTWEEYHRLSEEARRVESEAADLSAVMAVTDEPAIGSSVALQIRGDHRRLGDKVERGFPRLLSGGVPATMPRHQSGRLELAQWLTSPQQVLVPRVLVNRFWGWHFGRPLVATTENFGALSEPPTHPELLDWLARDFVEQGWSLKTFHRRILLSRAYQRGSQSGEGGDGKKGGWKTADDAEAETGSAGQGGQAFDDGRWLSSFPKRRLTGEELRDALLVGAGVLDGSMGGKSIPLRNRQFVFDHTSIDHTRYDGVRRTLYLPIVRNHLYGLLEQFDFPDPTMPAGRRHTTTVAPQALWLMNSELVLDCSQTLARNSVEEGLALEPAIEWVYQRLYQRGPSQQEVAAIAAFSGDGVADDLGSDRQMKQDGAHQRALWIQALLCSPEFYQLD